MNTKAHHQAGRCKATYDACRVQPDRGRRETHRPVASPLQRPQTPILARPDDRGAPEADAAKRARYVEHYSIYDTQHLVVEHLCPALAGLQTSVTHSCCRLHACAHFGALMNTRAARDSASHDQSPHDQLAKCTAILMKLSSNAAASRPQGCSTSDSLLCSCGSGKGLYLLVTSASLPSALAARLAVLQGPYKNTLTPCIRVWAQQSQFACIFLAPSRIMQKLNCTCQCCWYCVQAKGAAGKGELCVVRKKGALGC